jgi:cobalt-zinc-cadmium efflux system membrane fusion protein
VKEKDIRFIHEGDETAIEIAAFPDRKIKGNVYRINKMIDEQTRSVDVYIVVNNKDGALKKGMYATIRFSANQENEILISPKAMFLSSESSFAFLEVAPNTYVRKKIKTGDDDEATGEVVVKSGLKEGDKIIAEGGYYLMQIK